MGGLLATGDSLDAERERIAQRDREWVAEAAAFPWCRFPNHVQRTIKDGANKVHSSNGRCIPEAKPHVKYANKLQREMAKGLHFDWEFHDGVQR